MMNARLFDFRLGRRSPFNAAINFIDSNSASHSRETRQAVEILKEKKRKEKKKKEELRKQRMELENRVIRLSARALSQLGPF